MATGLPHLSTDQISAFVEIARAGQIRGAADTLGITEQGVRNRLIALETALGVELYRKSRGPRRSTLLTPQGRRFLPHALAFLERVHDLCRVCDLDTAGQEVHIVASQYLTRYVLIDVLKTFRTMEPAVHVRVSTTSEADVLGRVASDPGVAFGLAAPYETAPELVYHELFAMGWSLIAPPAHRLASKARVTLADALDEPLIVYERGSTGRQHVLDAFLERGLSPRIALETTSTETVVSMVEAGLGIAIVPLLPNGAVTRGRKVKAVPIRDAMRPIHSGLLVRREEHPSGPAARLIEVMRRAMRPAG